MKVLQLGKFYPIRGGVEKVMWDLTRGLSESGVDVDMLCAKLKNDGPDPIDKDRAYYEGKNLIIRFNDHGRIVCVPSLKKVAATMLSPKMIIFLRKHRKEYDVVHVHHPDPMAALTLFLSGYKGRVILHWHSDILKQKTLLKLFGPLQKWLIGRVEKIVGTTPIYVKESPFLKDVQDKITYLPIGAEDMAAGNVEKGSPIQKNIVYSLGRLVGYKGYTYLVRAARYLPEDYEIRIGGSGPLKEELEAEIAALEGAPHAKVTLLGRIPDEEMVQRYKEAKVFVLSSVWKTEAFAIVQIEAMSLGKPIVATMIPGSGVSWVNKDGYSGINVPIEDEKAIAKAILDICSEDKTYEEFSANARKRYEDNFTFEKMIEGCKNLYRMKLNPDFGFFVESRDNLLVRKHCGAVDLTKTYFLSEPAKWLFDKIGDREFDEEMLVEWLTGEFTVEEKTAREDIKKLINDWKNYGIIL